MPANHMLKKALFVGRFQPLHKGHVHEMERLFKEYAYVTIAIGSVNKRDEDNPFPYQLRRAMLLSSLEKYRGRFRIVGQADLNDDSAWAKSIKRKAVFDVAISGNARVRRCFQSIGMKTIEPVFYKPGIYSGTRIRKLINEQKRWQHLVPKEAAAIVENYMGHGPFEFRKKQY